MGQRSDRALEEKVHQLNRAIDDVRRQLEQLQPQA
jgi:signal transduction histidine kinase